MHIKITLKNGVRIIYENVPHVRSASLCVWIGVGSRYESSTENGVSHFIEHMVFKGTKNHSAEDLASMMDSLGGQVNAFTTKECTCFFGKVLDTHLDQLTDILCEMLFESRFDETDVSNERNVIYEEIDMYNDSPEDLVSERLATSVFKGSSLARPILGTKKSLEKISSGTLKEFMAKYYIGGSVVVSLSGSFTKNNIQHIMNMFSALPSGTVSPYRKAVYTPAFTSKRKAVEQNHFCIAFPGISDGDERRYAFSLMSSILGGGMSSRLFQSVRENRGLCYSIYSYTASYSDIGFVSLYTALNPETETAALDLIVSEVERFRDFGVTDDELERVREQAKANILLSLESTGNRASRLGRNELLLGYIPEIESIIDAYDCVSTADIQELAAEFLDFSRVSFSAVGHIRSVSKYAEYFSNLIHNK